MIYTVYPYYDIYGEIDAGRNGEEVAGHGPEEGIQRCQGGCLRLWDDEEDWVGSLDAEETGEEEITQEGVA